MNRELDRMMREALLELAMTSNGAVAGFDVSTSGGYYSDVIPHLGPMDAPAIYYAREYDVAETDARRRQLLTDARAELKSIRHSISDPSKAETFAEFSARVIKDGEGMTLLRCAQWARSSTRIIFKIREAAGRETTFGRRSRNGRKLKPAERLVAIQELLENGHSMRDAARALELSYNTVRRALGKSA